MGYGSRVALPNRTRMRRRRQEKHLLRRGQGARPKHNAEEDLQELLLPYITDRSTELLLVWCIASSFTAGILEVSNGSSTEQVKYRPKKRRSMSIAPHLNDNGFRVVFSRTLAEGDVQISFPCPEEAHQALQEAALANNRSVPWSSARLWGRPTARTHVARRRCYEGPPVRIAGTSLAQPPPCDQVTIVAGEVLACGDHKRVAMSYMCTKCSVAPWGILPLVLVATYPATRVEKCDDGKIWRLAFRMHGVREERDYHAPSPEVERLLDLIRKHMDTEFGTKREERHRVVDARRTAVLQLMGLLDQPEGAAVPMEPAIRETQFFDRGGVFAEALHNWFLPEVFSNDLAAFSLQ